QSQGSAHPPELLPQQLQAAPDEAPGYALVRSSFHMLPGNSAPYAATPVVPTVRSSYKTVTPPLPGMLPYAHAEDYSWLVGELRYLHTRRCWQVRFAPVNIENSLGGAVFLNGVDHLTDHFRDGMIVKVDRVLVDPGKRAPSPTYWVNNIRAVD